MPVAAIGGRHEAAMGAAEKLRGGPTWGPGGGVLLLPGGPVTPVARYPVSLFRALRNLTPHPPRCNGRGLQTRNVAALRQLRQFRGGGGKKAAGGTSDTLPTTLVHM